MVTIPSDDDDELFADPTREPHSPDHVDLDSGAWFLTYGSEAYRDLREAYLAYIDAGGKRQDWQAYREAQASKGRDLTEQSFRERAAALASRAIAAATGVKVHVPVRVPPPSVTSYVPLSVEEAEEGWEDWPGVPKPPSARSEPTQEPERGPVTPKVAPVSTPEPERTAPPASEHRANRWSSALGIPKHRRTRPSQTYEGRRRRTVRQYAQAHNLTIKQAEQKVPKRGPQPKRADNTQPEA